jgi:hypothetical protein
MGSQIHVVASFTSYPPRIGNCAAVIDSLAASRIPISIELNLSLAEFPGAEADLPGALQDRICRGIVTVNWVPDNPGVFKKIIPVLKKRQGEDYILLSVDDDRLYGPLYAEYMVSRLADYDAYCCDRGIVGNRAVYRAKIFRPAFWENLSAGMIETGIDDTYIRAYLQHCGARCHFFDDPAVRGQITVYNAVYGHVYPKELQRRAQLLADRCLNAHYGAFK